MHLIVQKEKKGFGHAVYQAYKYLKKEPVVMMLGDFIYKSNLELSCTRQTINAYNKSGGKAVVSIKRVPFEDSKNYGIIHGKFKTERPYLMDVDRMVEKPDPKSAREELTVDGECFATFGQYVLTDEIFQYLGQEIAKQEQAPESGEVDVTKALMNLAQKGELIGVDVDGESYDVGLPEMYYRTFVEYRR